MIDTAEPRVDYRDEARFAKKVSNLMGKAKRESNRPIKEAGGEVAFLLLEIQRLQSG